MLRLKRHSIFEEMAILYVANTLYSPITDASIFYFSRRGENYDKHQIDSTFLAGMPKVKSLSTWTSGREGYLKFTCLKSIFPSTFSSIMPSSLVELILGFLSMIASMDTVDSWAFVESVAIPLVWETPKAVKIKAK